MLVNGGRLGEADTVFEGSGSIMTPDRPLAFMHIPKAAGTSIRTAIAEATERLPAPYTIDLHHMGQIRRPDLIAPELRKRLVLHPDELRGQTGFLSGHFSLSTLIAGWRRAQYITLFREPVCRILSHWLFCRAVSDQKILPWGEEWSTIMRSARGSLMEFLEPGPAVPQTDNLILRMLLRPHSKIPETRLIDRREDDDLLAEARDRLSYFSYVDVVENRKLPANLAGWIGRPLNIRSLNERPEMPANLQRDLLADLDDAGFDALRLRSRLDRVLWRQIVRERMPGTDPDELATRTLARYMLALPRRLGATA